ncbi:hypothetical protein NYE67_02795 [Solibacillus sp. FSL W8-0474]
MSEQEFQKDLIETIIKFMFMLSKQDDEKRKETIEFFEKESGTKLLGEYK